MCASAVPETWATIPVAERCIYQLFRVLRTFLATPSGDHAVNSDASRVLQDDIDAFDRIARAKSDGAGGDDGDEDEDDDDDDA